MEDLLDSLNEEIKTIEKKDRLDTQKEIAQRQKRIAQNSDSFAPLPSQNEDSVKLHQAIVDGWKQKMTTTDLKKLFLKKKAKRKQARKAKRAEMMAEKMGEKRKKVMKKKKRRNRVKGFY
mmetsp:Transcript_12608/g.17531  ORF Transcript_12608/g.17531 Transcript_12608/m.17531 type:complete len:120 (+) Transcript_12608:80-439(+)